MWWHGDPQCLLLVTIWAFITVNKYYENSGSLILACETVCTWLTSWIAFGSGGYQAEDPLQHLVVFWNVKGKRATMNPSKMAHASLLASILEALSRLSDIQPLTLCASLQLWWYKPIYVAVIINLCVMTWRPSMSPSLHNMSIHSGEQILWEFCQHWRVTH